MAKQQRRHSTTSSSPHHDIPRSPRPSKKALHTTMNSSSAPSSPNSVIELYRQQGERSFRRRKRPIDINDPNSPIAPKRQLSKHARVAALPEAPSLEAAAPPPAPTKKGVRFHHRVKTRKHLSRHNMTPQETYECWFNERDYRMIERRNERTIQKIEDGWNTKSGQKMKAVHNRHNVDGVNPGSKELCGRGLENGLRSEYMSFEAYKRASYKAVFREQERLYKAGISGNEADEAIAKAYAKVSKKSRFRAWNRALLDEKEIDDPKVVRKPPQDDDIESENEDEAEDTSPRLALRKQFANVRAWVKAKHCSKHDRKV